MPLHRLTIVGVEHTAETSGFHRVQSDLPQLAFAGDEKRVYEEAIGEQDRAFIGLCQGTGSGIPWAETMRLMRKIQEFRLLPDGVRAPASTVR